MLSRDAIFKSLDALAAKLSIPELGGEIGIRRLLFDEAMQMAETGGNVTDSIASQKQFLVHLVLVGAGDQKGRRLFTDKDTHKVGRLPSIILQRIADAVLEANGLANESDALDDAVKNSGKTTAVDGS